MRKAALIALLLAAAPAVAFYARGDGEQGDGKQTGGGCGHRGSRYAFWGTEAPPRPAARRQCPFTQGLPAVKTVAYGTQATAAAHLASSSSARGSEWRKLGSSFDGDVGISFWSQDAGTIYFNTGVRATIGINTVYGIYSGYSRGSCRVGTTGT